MHKKDLKDCPIFLYQCQNCGKVRGYAGEENNPKWRTLSDERQKELQQRQDRGLVKLYITQCKACSH